MERESCLSLYCLCYCWVFQPYIYSKRGKAEVCVPDQRNFVWHIFQNNHFINQFMINLVDCARVLYKIVDICMILLCHRSIISYYHHITASEPGELHTVTINTRFTDKMAPQLILWCDLDRVFEINKTEIFAQWRYDRLLMSVIVLYRLLWTSHLHNIHKHPIGHFHTIAPISAVARPAMWPSATTNNGKQCVKWEAGNIIYIIQLSSTNYFHQLNGGEYGVCLL